MRTRFYLILFWGLLAQGIMAQRVIPRDSLISDLRQFLKYVEETHPDPYSGFGGKVFFHREAYDLEKRLSPDGNTAEEFSRLLTVFLSSIQDGHTHLQMSGSPEKNLYIPVKGRVIPEGIVISALPDSLKNYLGSRITGINGVSVDELLEKTGQISVCENLYGKYLTLAGNMSSVDYIERLTGKSADRFILNLITPAGNKADLELKPALGNVLAGADLVSVPEWEKTKGMEYMDYRFLDDARQVMYFRLQSVMAREAFLGIKMMGWPGLENQLGNYYRWTLKKEMPQNIDTAIAEIPALAGVFRNMLDEMKKQGSPYLVIDLRGNGGGFTPITLPTLYQLYGDKYLHADMNVRFYKMLSPLYLQKIDMTLEAYNQERGTSYEFGDYEFYDEGPDNSPVEQLRENFVQQSMGDAPEYIKDLNGKPVYAPEQIFVITDARTFSAAFHYAFYLWKMGATVIGVPCSQSPNAFMEMTPFRLEHTGIDGSISNSVQYFLPPSDKRARVFYPDWIPGYSDYQKYGFDKESEIRYLLDKLTK